MRGAGFGLIGNIVVGIIGALVAGWLLPQIGVVLAAGTLGQILDATVGAGRRSRHSLTGQAHLTASFICNDRQSGDR